MMITLLITILTLVISLYVQARLAAGEIRRRRSNYRQHSARSLVLGPTREAPNP